jgi:hypothetical protein
MLNSRVSYSIIVFILSMIILFIVKPKLAFDQGGNIRNFGLQSKTDTIYSIGVLSIILSIIIFYMFCLIDLVF